MKTPSAPARAILLLALAVPFSAQSAPIVLPGPIGSDRSAAELAPQAVRASYSLRTGAVTHTRFHDPSLLAASAAAPFCFDNSALECDMGPFEPYTIGSALGDEILDWGVKDCAGTGLVASITIAYRSTALDIADGGPGAAIGFALYSGTQGWNTVGNEIFRKEFRGLPAQRAPAGDSHSAPFVFLTIDFGDAPLALPDGPVGWGYTMLDNTDPLFATGALLVSAPSQATGVIDAVDVYAPGPANAGNYAGTFNFSNTCNHPPCCPKASMWLQIAEVSRDATVVNGNGVNPVLLSQDQPATLGQVWGTSFDLSAYPPATVTMVFTSSGQSTPLATPLGELLIDMSSKIGRPTIAMGSHVMAVPMEPSLIGLVLHVQGVVRADVPVLTNALKLTLTL